MQAKVELQVLDEPVRPVDATCLTAQTGLTGHATCLTAQTGLTGHVTGLTAHTTGNTNSAMKGDSSLKPKIRTGGFI